MGLGIRLTESVWPASLDGRFACVHSCECETSRICMSHARCVTLEWSVTMFGMEIIGVTYPKGVFEVQEE